MRSRGLPVVVLALGLALIALLTWACVMAHDNNEDRLLTLQVRQAASVVKEAIPAVQTPLTAASQLAEVTDGDPTQFNSALQRYVGPGRSFSAAVLWNVATNPPKAVATIGRVAFAPGVTQAVVAAPATSNLVIRGNLEGARPSLLYADSAARGSKWVVSAEAPLPKNRKLTIASNNAFGNINYALYLGSTTKDAELLGASVPVPITARHAVAHVPFGTTMLTVVGTPKGELGGTLLARLPLIVAIVGVLLSILAAALTRRLVSREQQAEERADRNRELYAAQRGITEELQLALLPQSLPEVCGIETACRYIAGSDGIDVGGDWYEVVPIDDEHFVFALGDVSGRGVTAASLMARVSHAIEAYALDMVSPSDLMTKVESFIERQHDGLFATVLCGMVDVRHHQITLVNAGHPPPILLTNQGAELVAAAINPPIGLQGVKFESTTICVPPQSTLVAFTDGLFERRGEALDRGLERLRTAAAESRSQPLEALLDAMIEGSETDGNDDTALLGIRWLN